MIEAITFDLWDTLIHDESDEPRRASLGLLPKREARRGLVYEALSRHVSVPADAVSMAYDVADAAFNKVWHDQHVTWTIAERLSVLLGGLGHTLPGEEMAALVAAHETMEVDVAPDPVEGIADALAQLAPDYKLGVVSDTIVSPGHCLRELLAKHGVARYFDAFAFSDEVGHSKPHPDMFRHAARELGVELAHMVHLGDRDHNDIKGAQAAGMKAILFTATRDTDRAHTSADAICERAGDLPGIVARLAREG